MNKKQLLTYSLIGIVCFVLGYWAKTLNSEKKSISSTQAKGEVQNVPVDTTQENEANEIKRISKSYLME